MRKAFIILGNGFTIDFLQYYSKVDSSINEKIDVCNLFRLGDKISTPWEEKPGFLSFKNCPALWTLGARPYNTKEESNALIEEIITCANMFFDFVNEPEQKTKRLELTNSNKDKIYLRAYSELNMYLRHLFSSYNTMITDKQLEKFLNGNTSWGWIDFFKAIEKSEYDKITFVTYNYDIWLERILKILKIPFRINGFDKSCDEKVEIIKPHGSISFVPKGDISAVYSVNYNLDFEGVPIEQLEIQYDNLTRYPKGAIIPPAGDSMRLGTTAPWSQKLRNEAKNIATNIEEKDEIVLCGISYWHVDRRELDELLINLNQDSNFTFVNPMPPRDLNAVLSSIFTNYVQQHSSSEIGGILNGKAI